MKRALVFSGGGSRGAYEIGAWQAFQELGMRFSAVYGTSIGALNAALAAQGDVELALKLWDSITLSQVVALDSPEDFSIDRMVSRKRDVIPFLLENARHLRMDITPLEETVKSNLSESRIRAGGVDLGVMTFRVPQMQPVPMMLSDMATGSLGDWIIASASCFPVFPVRHIQGQRYIDGGYYDNLPIDMALAEGADEVVAVDVHPEHTHPEYARMPWLTTVKPLHSLGGFLDFDAQLIHRSRRMGYYDAMKHYGRFDGFAYTFRQVNALSVTASARSFMNAALAFDGVCIRRGAIHMGQTSGAPLLSALEAETQQKVLSWKAVWLRGLELCARTMGFREDAIYDAQALLGKIRAFARAEDALPLDETGLREAERRGGRVLFTCLYRGLEEKGAYPEELIHRLSQWPEAVGAALFLHSVE